MKEKLAMMLKKLILRVEEGSERSARIKRAMRIYCEAEREKASLACPNAWSHLTARRDW